MYDLHAPINILSCVYRYSALYLGFIPRAEHRGLNENMANLLRTLSSSEFSSYLQFVCEALSSNGLALDKTACLIRLISLALHNAPESQSYLSI